MVRKLILHINSGICKCGCKWDDHHLSMIMNTDAIVAMKLWYEQHYPDDKFEGVNGYPLYGPEECEKFGFNELGGKKLNEETEEYKDHCHRYEDKDGPLAEIEW
jgi:hypothetical protein